MDGVTTPQQNIDLLKRVASIIDEQALEEAGIERSAIDTAIDTMMTTYIQYVGVVSALSRMSYEMRLDDEQANIIEMAAVDLVSIGAPISYTRRGNCVSVFVGEQADTSEDFED